MRQHKMRLWGMCYANLVTCANFSSRKMVAEKNDEKMTRVAPEGRADSLKLGDTGLDF